MQKKKQKNGYLHTTVTWQLDNLPKSGQVSENPQIKV